MLRSANYLYLHWLIFKSLFILCPREDLARSAEFFLDLFLPSTLTTPLGECPL